MTNLIAMVDGSIYSESVCDHASWLARRMSADVIAVHVLGHRQGVKSDLSGSIGLGARTAILEELAELDAAKAKLAQKRGRAILEDAKTRITAAGVAHVETRLRNGDLLETIQGMEDSAEMLVIGKRGEAADFAKLHLGSNLERVARTSKLPLMVCAREFRPIERLVIAFDGGPSSLKAVDHVARSQVFKGLPVHLVTVGGETTDLKRKQEGAVALLRGGGFDASATIVQGQPEDVLSAQVGGDTADVLLMGAYGRSRIREMIIGSTTTQMIRSCHVPIVLFR